MMFMINPDIWFVLQKWRQEAKNNIAASKVFANENFMNFSTLMTLVGIKAQFLDYLVTIGFVPEHCRMHQKRSGQDRILDVTGPEVSCTPTFCQKMIVKTICIAIWTLSLFLLSHIY